MKTNTKNLSGRAYLAAIRHGMISDRELEADLARASGNISEWARVRGTCRPALRSALAARGVEILQKTSLVFRAT